jgi:hypothetical protein
MKWKGKDMKTLLIWCKKLAPWFIFCRIDESR